MNRLEFILWKGWGRSLQSWRRRKFFKKYPKPKWCEPDWNNVIMSCWGYMADIDSGRLNAKDIKQVIKFCENCEFKDVIIYNRIKDDNK